MPVAAYTWPSVLLRSRVAGESYQGAGLQERERQKVPKGVHTCLERAADWRECVGQKVPKGVRVRTFLERAADLRERVRQNVCRPATRVLNISSASFCSSLEKMTVDSGSRTCTRVAAGAVLAGAVMR